MIRTYQDVTPAVLKVMAQTTDPRLREVMTAQILLKPLVGRDARPRLEVHPRRVLVGALGISVRQNVLAADHSRELVPNGAERLLQISCTVSNTREGRHPLYCCRGDLRAGSSACPKNKNGRTSSSVRRPSGQCQPNGPV